MSCALQLFAPKSQQFNLIFSGSPYRRLGQGRLDNHPRERWSGNLFLPPPTTDITPLPHSTASVKRFAPPLGRAGLLTGAEINGTGPDGCLPELDMIPLLQVMCLWYMCFCAEVFFSVLRLYSKWSIVWGLKIFSSSLSSCKSCIFLNTLSPVLSTPLSYVCCVCMVGLGDKTITICIAIDT